MSIDSIKIPYYRPMRIDTKDFYCRAERIFEACWFSNGGENVVELERSIAELHHVKHCIAVCNGTVGLQLALKGLALAGEVITTPFSFIATAHAIKWIGLTPVFCDIDPKTLTISPERIAEKITDRTSAILGVHVFGQTCDVDAIDKIAKNNGLKVVYDAAHGFKTSYRGVSIGNFGEAEVLSFHATKLFHTFEGGAILTNNDELANKIRSLKNFGFTGMDQVDHLGTNGKMNEMSAAFGISLLPYVDRAVSSYKEINSNYRRLLGDIEGLSFFDVTDDVSSNGQYIPIFIDEEKFGMSRDQLWTSMWEKGIQTRRYFYPALNMCEPYCSDIDELADSCPVTKKISESVLCLPCYYDLVNKDIIRLSEVIHETSSRA